MVLSLLEIDIVWLETNCKLTFEIPVPVPFVLMLRPRSGALQWVSREEYRLQPSVPVFEFTDNYGNLCQRLIAPSGNFEIFTSAEVMTADRVDQSIGAPFVEIQGMLGNGARLKAAIVRGIEPTREPAVSALHEHLVFGELEALRPGSRNIVLGRLLAAQLAVGPGDRLTLMGSVEAVRELAERCA
mgnify:CR=1 FL=1